MRDVDENPYSADEHRIATFFAEKGTGGGDDPIGFILCSYEYLVAERATLRAVLSTARAEAEAMRKVAEFATTFKISDSNNQEVAEDSLHEIRKKARAALAAFPRPASEGEVR